LSHPRYEIHNITLSGDIHPATYDTDRKRREYTCQEGFEQSKTELCRLALCRQPDFDKEIVLCTDSSQFGMGCIAAQEVHGKLCPLEYYSATHTDQAKRYGSSKRECLAIIKSIEHFAPLVNDSRFKCRLYTDHAPLTSLTNPGCTSHPRASCAYHITRGSPLHPPIVLYNIENYCG
jgi:hypothetical protein